MNIRSRLLYLLLLSAVITACSALDSSAPVMTQQELLRQIKAKADILILDVRTSGEYGDGHIPGAYHIDHRAIASHLKEIEPYRNRPVVVYCYSGMRAGMVESFLMEQGFSKIRHLQGDWSAWEAAGLPSE